MRFRSVRAQVGFGNNVVYMGCVGRSTFGISGFLLRGRTQSPSGRPRRCVGDRVAGVKKNPPYAAKAVRPKLGLPSFKHQRVVDSIRQILFTPQSSVSSSGSTHAPAETEFAPTRRPSRGRASQPCAADRAAPAPRECAAARSISKCLYCPARLSAERTAQRWTLLNRHKETCISSWYFRLARRRFPGDTSRIPHSRAYR